MLPSNLLRSRGFTLIELLIVVAIIAILAAIAVPNFLEAQTRSKVSRARADMRTLATAIESYRVDWNRYPDAFKAAEPPGFFNNRLKGITTPVAYVTSLPLDVFRTKRKRSFDPPQNDTATYEYLNKEVAIGGFAKFSSEASYVNYFRNDPGWYMVSPGPFFNLFPFDGDWPLETGGTGGTSIIATPAAAGRRKIKETYDPTNGTVSLGALWRTSADVQ